MMHSFDHSLDMIITIALWSFWILFPVGLFLSVGHVDKNTDQNVQSERNRLRPTATRPLRVLEIPRPEKEWHWSSQNNLSRVLRH